MKKLIFAFLNAVLIIAVVIGDIHYIDIGTLRIKSITSILFVLIGLINLLYGTLTRAPMLFPTLMTTGLFFAMLGDIMLGYSFMLGALLFGVGHVLYFSAFCVLAKPRKIDIFPAALLCIGAVVTLLYYPRFRFNSEMLRICLAYAVIISLMTGKAIANFIRSRDLVTCIAMLGSIFFFVSDLMLVLHKFGGRSELTDILCLAFYYPSECLLGFTLFLYINRAVRN